MLPNMYKIAGEQLPGVFHVGARTVQPCTNLPSVALTLCPLARLALHFSQKATSGRLWIWLPVAHLAAVRARFRVNFFDGFRTSHEISEGCCFGITLMAECDGLSGIPRLCTEPKIQARGSHGTAISSSNIARHATGL